MMEKELPEGWVESTIGESCGIYDAVRVPVNSAERNARISGKPEIDLFPYYGATGKVGLIDGFLFDGEYVLIGEDGAPFLDPFKAKAYMARGKFWVNNHAHIISLSSSNHFLCHYLNQTAYAEFVTGTTRLKLNQERLKKIPFPLPPLNEQKRIVAKIEELFSELDAGIESIKQAKTQLGVYRQALLKKAFEGNLTAQWRTQHPSVSALAEPPPLHRGGVCYYHESSSPSTQQNSPPFQGGVAEGRGGLGRGGYPALNNLPHLKTFRKQLRSKMTPAEARLWTHLKGKQLDGRKFRRQHSVANYILDFYCPEERLAIELDGEVHNNVVASEYDYERDLFLQHTGIKVLRFENRIVFENSAWLLDQVRSHFGHSEQNSPSHSHSHSPPFQGGVPEGRGGFGVPEGRGGSQLLERIRTEREARYQQQLDEWRSATAAWEKHDKQGKKPAKPRQPKPVEPLTPEDRAALPALPEGWAWGRLGEAIVGIDAGKSFSCDERPPSGNEIGVAKVSAVSWGEYNESESKTCIDRTKEIAEYIIKPGDFLLSRANTIDLVGACVIVQHTQKKIMLSDKTLRVKFVTLTPEFVLQYLRSRTGRLEIMKRSSGNQESMRNIGQDRVSAINIPLCPLPEQREIVRVLEEQFTVIEQNEQEIDAALTRAEALRQAILKKAFSGRLGPQDPNDEPASILLERIRAERAAAATQSKPSRKPPRRKSSTGGVHP